MILSRRKTDINLREVREMFGTFIMVTAVGISGLIGGFHQKETNPQAHSFFESSSHIVKDGSSAD